ncbi:MAG: NfeD family protein [Candidatus Heimdallarchaeota archaeon]
MPAVALLVVTLILLRRWVDLPAWFVWGLVALWVAKDVAFFPFVWHSYDRERGEDTSPMVGAQGIVEERLAPSGYVRVHGELWQAEVVRGGSPIDRGQVVRIEEVRGLTLLVQIENDEGID